MLLAVYQHQTDDGCLWLLALDKARFGTIPDHLKHVHWKPAQLRKLDDVSSDQKELVRQDVQGQGYAIVRTTAGIGEIAEEVVQAT